MNPQLGHVDQPEKDVEYRIFMVYYKETGPPDVLRVVKRPSEVKEIIEYHELNKVGEAKRTFK